MKKIFQLTMKAIHDFFRYGIGYIIRWFFIFSAFIYLIVLTIALHEALHFQKNVAKLFTEESITRRVLVELYNHMDSSNSAPKEMYPVPFGAMAIRLDSLKNAVKELSNYQLKEKVKENTADENKSGNAKDSPSIIKAEYEQEISVLKPALINLHDLLFENSSMKIVETFMGIQEISKELRQYVIQAPEKGEKQDPEQSSFQNQAAVESQILAQQLKTALKDLGNDLSKEDFEKHKEDIIALEKEIDNLRSSRAAANQFNASIQKIKNLSFVLKETILDDREKLSLNQFEIIHEKIQHLEDEHLVVAKQTSAALSPFDYPNAIDELSKTLIAVEQNLALAEEYKEIEELKDIAYALNKMILSVAAINDLSDIEVERSGSNLEKSRSPQEKDTTTAQLTFENNLGVLNSAILALEKDFSDQKPAAMLALIIGSDPQAQLKATTILTDYKSLSEFDAILLPFQQISPNEKRHPLYNLGINTRYIATLGYESLELLFVFVIGAIGSLLYITKYYLQMTIQGHGWLDRPSRPLSWYLFRPIFGIVVALAIYLTVKAGQLAMGGSDSLGKLNLPIFSLISLFAGLLSWHALDAIESRAKRWFNTQSRRNLYATGLKHALSIEGKSTTECASQIGCSEEQIIRWMKYYDKVTPEMQDRLITWLDRSVGEVFGDKLPGKTPLLTQEPEDGADDSKDKG